MKKIAIIIICSIIGSQIMYAQPGKDLKNDEVDVVKTFDAKLLEAEKLKLQPYLPAADTTGKEQEYIIQGKAASIEYLPPKLRPIGMKTQALPPAYKGYAKLGAGIPSSIFGEAGYNFIQKDKLNVGLFVHHYSLNRKKIEHQKFNDTYGQLNGSYYTPQNMTVGASLGFGQRNYYYYGYDSTLVNNRSLTEAQARQRYGLFDGAVRVGNTKTTDNGLDYKGEFSFYRLRDNFAARENNVQLGGSVTKWFGEKHPLNIGLRTDFTTLDTGDIKQKLNNFYLTPSFTYHAEVFSIKAGLNLVSNNDEFYFLPDAEATANIMGATLAAFVGWKGDFQKNTLKTFSDYNPFINARQELRNTQYSKIYGGVKGNIRIFEYSVQGGYGKYSNQALYLANVSDSLRRFGVVYDTMKIVHFGGTLIVRPIKDLELTALLNNNIYTPTEQTKPWGLPSFELNVGATYKTLNDKLRLKGNLFMQNGVSYINAENKEDRLNTLFDISIGAEYWFLKNVAAFVDFNNLANNQYQRWFNYPTIGTNILGGVTARF